MLRPLVLAAMFLACSERLVHADASFENFYRAINEAIAPVKNELKYRSDASILLVREETMLTHLYDDIKPIELIKVDAHLKKELARIDQAIKQRRQGAYMRPLEPNGENIYREDFDRRRYQETLTRHLDLKERIQGLLLQTYKISGEIYENPFDLSRDGQLMDDSKRKIKSPGTEVLNPATRRAVVSHVFGTLLIGIADPSLILLGPALTAASVLAPRYYGAIRARLSKGGSIYKARERLSTHLSVIVAELNLITRNDPKEWAGRGPVTCERLLTSEAVE